MNTTKPMVDGTKFLMIAASMVVVIAGMRAAQKILVPFLLAVFVAIICMQPFNWLRRKKVPTAIALTLVVIGILSVSTIFLALVGTSLDRVTRDLGSYQERLEAKVDEAIAYLQGLGFNISDDVWLTYFNTDAVMELVTITLSGVGNILSNGMMILFTIIFLLLEASDIPGKLRAISGNTRASFPQIRLFLTNINKYMALKTLISLGTGIVIAGYLAILGVDYPILWGLLAFLLNYIPTIGSLIAAIPAVILAWVQIGFGTSVLVALGYSAVNAVFGNGIEPRVMGKGLGLSTLVAFLSLVLWGWILGPVGMFLSVPLTMTLKLALQSSPDTRWVAILLGDAVQSPPPPGSALAGEHTNQAEATGPVSADHPPG